jgi:hypothetical protein
LIVVVLPAPFGPKQPVDLPSAEREAHIVDCQAFAEPSGQLCAAQYGLVGHLRSVAGGYNRDKVAVASCRTTTTGTV